MWEQLRWTLGVIALVDCFPTFVVQTLSALMANGDQCLSCLSRKFKSQCGWCIQEIEAVVPDATKKDIGKAYKTIMACLQAEDGVSHQSTTVVFSTFSTVETAAALQQPNSMTCSCHDLQQSPFAVWQASMLRYMQSVCLMLECWLVTYRALLWLQSVLLCPTLCEDSVPTWA